MHDETDSSEIDWAGLTIEVSQDGVSTAILNSSDMPKLAAHRPEARRLFRLARIFGAAKALSRSRLGPDGPQMLSIALASLEDYKGDFLATWHASRNQDAFEQIIAEAMTLEGEDPVEQLTHGFVDNHHQKH
jgi:hypothetical protein